MELCALQIDDDGDDDDDDDDGGGGGGDGKYYSQWRVVYRHTKA